MSSGPRRTVIETVRSSTHTRRGVLRVLGVVGIFPFLAGDSVSDAAASSTRRATQSTTRRESNTGGIDAAQQTSSRDLKANAPAIGWRHDFDQPVTDLAPAGDGVVAAVGKSLVELDSDGNVAWSRTYDLDYDITALGKTTSGFAFAAGSTSYDPYDGTVTTLVSVDTGGAELWSTTLGQNGSSVMWFINAIMGTQSGRLLVAGTMASRDQPNAFVSLYGKCGTLERDLSPEEGDLGSGISDMISIPGGDGYAATGYINFGYPVFFNTGSAQRYETHLGRSNALTTGVDGGYVIGGSVSSRTPRTDPGQVFLLAVDADGTERWYQNYTVGRHADGIGDITSTKDGYVFTAFSSGTGWLVGVDASGTVRWERELGDGGDVLLAVGGQLVVAVGSSVVSIATT